MKTWSAPLALLLTLISGPVFAVEYGDDDDSREEAGPTPPRLSYISGSASFWRPGAEDWTEARINTPMAPGDLLSTDPGGTVEVQIGAQGFVRAGEETQLELEDLEQDSVRFEVNNGHVALDLRTFPGSRIEVDTPNATILLTGNGYYRLDVDPERTTVTARRGGHALITPAGGPPTTITADEQAVISGTATPTLATYGAAEPSSWDQWNYDRTDQLINTESANYVSPDVYGLDTLDRHGTWQTAPSYGRVWVPSGVAPGWAPYTTGSWVWDPYYTWTWIDDAPWGWAPYHYGRWVYWNRCWAWAPGPIFRPYYAPALVAFFGYPYGGISVGFGAAPISWVALGWGEPFIPWWGRRGFIGRPCWRGWRGPRVVNNVIINNNTIINANNIKHFRNTKSPNGLVSVPRNRFGRGPTSAARLTRLEASRLQPIRGSVAIRPGASSFATGQNRGVQRADARRTGPRSERGIAPNPASGRDSRGVRRSEATSAAARERSARRGSADLSGTRPGSSYSSQRERPAPAPRAGLPASRSRQPRSRATGSPGDVTMAAPAAPPSERAGSRLDRSRAGSRGPSQRPAVAESAAAPPSERTGSRLDRSRAGSRGPSQRPAVTASAAAPPSERAGSRLDRSRGGGRGSSQRPAVAEPGRGSGQPGRVGSSYRPSASVRSMPRSGGYGRAESRGSGRMAGSSRGWSGGSHRSFGGSRSR